MLTDDENIVDIQFAVQYTVKDPEDFLFNVRRPEQVVMQVAESATREIVGKSSMDFVLYEGREQIAAAAQKLMQDILDRYRTGVSISRVTMQNAQPPEQVQAAFDDAVKAKQDLERQKNEGQAYYNDVVPKARGTASRLIEEANGYRQRVVANAEGEAARFRSVLAEYAKAPAVTRERLYLETMQQIMSSTSKVMIDARGGGNLLMLPLDKILQMPAGAAGDGTGARPAEAPAVPEPPARARDSLRSRDREGRP
jgi:membrane protease subunit HflK